MSHTRGSDKRRYRKYVPEELDELSYMEYNLDGTTFKKHFMDAGGSESTANHLWSKFHAHDHSFLGMFGYLDTENINIVTKALNSILQERKVKHEEFIKLVTKALNIKFLQERKVKHEEFIKTHGEGK